MIKVLHVVGDSKFGGGSVIVLRLAEKARDMGWQVDVLTTDPTFKKVLQDAGIGVVKLDAVWREIRPLRDLRGVFRLYRFFRESEYSVVHTHTSKGGFVGRLAAWLARVPVVIHTVHGFAFHEETHPLVLHFVAFLERLAARWCDRIVTVSEFHRKWALRLRIGNEDKVVAIPNGIPEERVLPKKEREEVRAELGLGPEEIAILATGRLAPQKGLEYLVQAVPLLFSRIECPFKVFLAGDGPLRLYLEELIKRLGVENRIIFLGFRDDMGDLLAACDLVVLPSLREGLSIALLEAMAAGKPIITTTIGSNLEVVQHGVTALLVPSKDPGALAEAITSLLRDPELMQRLGSRAREVYLERYTEERMLMDYINTYKKVYEAKKSNGAFSYD
ncbi:MAG: glycosyltransferase family 4 protein [Bacillota bacterium]|nr:glycosyltransferase family 4 protein [Bacillota bacterium]